MKRNDEVRGARLITELATMPPERLDDLRLRLAEAAGKQGILDLAYRTLDTPVGPLLLARTETGLVRVAYAAEGFDSVLQSLADRISPRILEAPSGLDRAARQIDEYFAGRRRSFELPLDRRLSAGFRLTVQRHLGEIPYGRTETYGEVAAIVGSPGAARAVGSACATNPLPVVVPCHRVLRGDGSLGGYVGGTAAKSELLGLERERD